MRVRCPHCHHPTEVADDDSLVAMTCTACDSQFNLVSGTSTCTYTPSGSMIGHFELLQQVGVGAFGAVWRARDTQLERIVALKIQRGGPTNATESERFLRDAKAAAKLAHPGIAAVYEVGAHEQTLYIAGEFIYGANLKEFIASQRVSSREAAELVMHVAEAVQHAHDAGVVHRDLKPANIMIDVNGRPHVIDFGLAKRDGGDMTVTVEGMRLGTPAYMSPEQARGDAHKVDGRSDIYSIGVILFELLTGERPFRGDERMLTLQILRDDPPKLRSINSHVPRELEIITLKCLQKEPRNRYQTAGELAGDLRNWLVGDKVLARQPSIFHELVRWCCRFERIQLAGSFSLLLLAVFFAWTAHGIFALAVGLVKPTDYWEAMLTFIAVEGIVFPIVAWNSWFAAKGRIASIWLGLVFSIGLCAFSVLALNGVIYYAGGVFDEPMARHPTMSLAIMACIAAIVVHVISIIAYYANRDVVALQRSSSSRRRK